VGALRMPKKYWRATDLAKGPHRTRHTRRDQRLSARVELG
jgi:hypothetical protein